MGDIINRAMWTAFFVIKLIAGVVVLIAWPFEDTSKYESVLTGGHPCRVGVDSLLMAYLAYFAFVRHNQSRRMTKERC